MVAFEIAQAALGDLDGIMGVEQEAFAPGIREERATFHGRLRAFPEGNLVLRRRRAAEAVAGYFSSEIWDCVPPARAEFWALGHSAEMRHRPGGSVLYVSSFAVGASARGWGRFLFTQSIERLTQAFPRIERVAFIVCEDWLPARHIYETENFRYTGRLDGFFRPDALARGASRTARAALIMEKDV